MASEKTPEKSKPKLRVRKSVSQRDKAVKAQKKSDKPHRVRRGLSAVKRPVAKIRRSAKQEYHLIRPRESGLMGWLTKTRYWTPRYFRDSFAELKLVSWPGRKETWKMVLAVFLFSAVVGIIISLVDYGLEKLFREVLL